MSMMRAFITGLGFLIVAAGPLTAQQATVSGKFLGNGKDGKLQYLLVNTREPWSDEPAIKMVFTEKNPASSKDPGFDAGFGKLGSALLLSVQKDGGIFGCEVAHTAHKGTFSALGRIKMDKFEVTESRVSGHVTTNGQDDAFGQTWEVDLTFSAPLPKGAFVMEANPSPTPEPDDEPKKPKGPRIAAHKLPLPTSAKNVEYKTAVEQIAFASNAPVDAVAKDFSAKLKVQGWKESPGSLVSKANAILKRELDGATLTIMVQPAAGGSSVKVFSTDLDWSETPDTQSKPAQGKTADDIEADANKLIQDALKQIPGGF